MKFPLSIKFRLALWYLLILGVILAFFSTVTYFLLDQSLFNVTQSPSHLTVIHPLSLISTTQVNSESEITDQPVPIMAYTISAEWLSNLQSKSTSILSISTPFGQMSIDQKDFITADMEGEQQVRLFLRSAPNSPLSFEVLAEIQPVSVVNATLAAFRRALFIAIPITAVLAAGLGFLLVWRMLKPLNAITRTAREIEEKDLNRRIEVPNNDELGKLAATLNQTFERLQKAFERERQFTGDASHELRTPLAIMRGEATLALNKERGTEEYRKSLELISQEASRMSSIINKLLVLARADSGKESLSFSPVNLNALLSELAVDTEALCEDKSLNFKLDMAAHVNVTGDEIKLRELFLNLLDNAVRYTPHGGSVTLSLDRKGSFACISVKDTGIGISPEHLPHIFNRFYRVDQARSRNAGGAGLGLAICQGIAELHGGKIEVASQPGVGSTFSVLLPLTAQ